MDIEANQEKTEVVVLLHGLARRARSMRPMARFLEKSGYTCISIGYPSTRYRVEELAEQIRPRIESLLTNFDTIHFVTHSMGGIILRQLNAVRPLLGIGRCVMLGPPNRGSHVVDRLGSWRMFRWINGPAGTQLGTSDTSLPNRLGKVDFEVGVIAGDRSVNWFLSLLIPGPNDGKVAVSRASVPGQADFALAHATHPFLMGSREVQAKVLAFLKHGKFIAA